MSAFGDDKLRYARLIILVGAGLFVSGYIYKNLPQFFEIEESERKFVDKGTEIESKAAPSNETDAEKIFYTCPKCQKIVWIYRRHITFKGSICFKCKGIDMESYETTGVDLTESKEEKVEESVIDIQTAPKFPVQAFVRMRPLVGKEIVEKHESINYSVKTNKKKETQSLVLKGVTGRNNERDKKYTGFRRVLQPKLDNKATFDTCLLPSIPHLWNGQKMCIFAYGHTGSGKTHTIFGYSKENVPGMYQLFAREIINNKVFQSDEDMFIEIRFTELYQGKIRDLLMNEKQECFLREDENGRIHLRTQPVICDDGKIRAYPITGIRVREDEKLLEVIRDGIGSRNVGNSTLHDKSSRSHAFLEFELVTTELVKLREELVEKEADILHTEKLMDILWNKHKEKDEKKLKLLSDLGLTGRDYERLKDELKVLKKEAKEMYEGLNYFMNNKDRPEVGGTMVFVDLAGNEYGRDVKNKDVQEERERNEINKSLLALKECIRALHNKKEHVGYRNSKLTMYLRKYLSGQDSKAIMISNIGSSKEYAKQTINTLQYAQLVAKA